MDSSVLFIDYKKIKRYNYSKEFLGIKESKEKRWEPVALNPFVKQYRDRCLDILVYGTREDTSLLVRVPPYQDSRVSSYLEEKALLGIHAMGARHIHQGIAGERIFAIQNIQLQDVFELFTAARRKLWENCASREKVERIIVSLLNNDTGAFSELPAIKKNLSHVGILSFLPLAIPYIAENTEAPLEWLVKNYDASKTPGFLSGMNILNISPLLSEHGVRNKISFIQDARDSKNKKVRIAFPGSLLRLVPGDRQWVEDSLETLGWTKIRDFRPVLSLRGGNTFRDPNGVRQIFSQVWEIENRASSPKQRLLGIVAVGKLFSNLALYDRESAEILEKMEERKDLRKELREIMIREMSKRHKRNKENNDSSGTSSIAQEITGSVLTPSARGYLYAFFQGIHREKQCEALEKVISRWKEKEAVRVEKNESRETIRIYLHSESERNSFDHRCYLARFLVKTLNGFLDPEILPVSYLDPEILIGYYEQETPKGKSLLITIPRIFEDELAGEEPKSLEGKTLWDFRQKLLALPAIPNDPEKARYISRFRAKPESLKDIRLLVQRSKEESGLSLTLSLRNPGEERQQEAEKKIFRNIRNWETFLGEHSMGEAVGN